MRDEYFEEFVATFGEATSRVSVPALSFKKYQGVLPVTLLTYWKKEGWCSYANGLVWTVNPEEYRGLVTLWLEGTPYENLDEYHVIARTAFGTLYAWGARNNRTLTISCPSNALVGIDKQLRTPNDDPESSMQIFFAGMDREDCDLEDEEGAGLFEQALEKLGPLAPDEVYGFEPALVAGGPPRVKNLEKLNLLAHLSVLRELAEPTIPFADVDPGL